MTVYSKAVIVFLPILFANVAAGQDDKIEGGMTCLVTGQNLLFVREGKSESYLGFADQVDIGETLQLDYSLNYNHLKLVLHDSLRKNEYVQTSVDIGSIMTRIIESGNDFMSRDGTLNKITVVGEETLAFENPFVGELKLSRYYKNDWQGVYLLFDPNLTGNRTMSVHAIALDCRDASEGLDDLRERLLQKISER